MSPTTSPLLDAARSRGFAAETTALDMGYDNARVYAECEDRDSRPIIPLRETVGVKRGDHRPPTLRAWRVAVRRVGCPSR